MKVKLDRMALVKAPVQPTEEILKATLMAAGLTEYHDYYDDLEYERIYTVEEKPRDRIFYGLIWKAVEGYPHFRDATPESKNIKLYGQTIKG